MKNIGLLGGMSWASSVEYYRIINDFVSKRLGKLHSAKCILYSFDFEQIVEMQSRGDWKQMEDYLARAAETLENAGADMVLICTNTMHKVADKVESSINVPLVNIIDVTAQEIKSREISKVGYWAVNLRWKMDSTIRGWKNTVYPLLCRRRMKEN